MQKGETSLAEMAKDLGVNKSKLIYYQSIRLLKPIRVEGKMGIFDKKSSSAIIKKIEVEKKKGKKLKEIKDLLLK